jgi:hypothetical protein
MACPNCKKGLKMASGTLGVKLKICWKKLFARIVTNIVKWRNFEITDETTIENTVNLLWPLWSLWLV